MHYSAHRAIFLILFFLGFFGVFGLGGVLFNTIVLAPSKNNSIEQVAGENIAFDEHEATPSALTVMTSPEPTPTPTPMPTVQPIPIETPVPTPQPAVGSSLFTVVNQYRVQSGRSALTLHAGLCQHIQDRQSDIAHGVHSDLSPAAFQTYCPECSAMAENMARGYNDDQAILSAWLASDSHRVNIEGSWVYGCALRFGSNAAALFGR